MAERRKSPRQEQMLQFIREYTAVHAYPPSVREIGVKVGISSTSVVDYNLKALARRGLLRRDPSISRGIELLDSGERPADRVSVPVIGAIAAGAPIEALEGHHERLTLTTDIVPSEGVFALRVKGKSMIEDLIDDGDLVLIRPQPTAENGQIVVAMVTNGPGSEGQVTLKRFYRESGRVRLQPANATMEPIYVHPADVQIQGRVVCVIRQLA